MTLNVEVDVNDVEQLYRTVILDHSRRPRHHGTLEAPSITQEGANVSCGDRLTLQLRVQGDRIVQVAFTGSGCAVSQATASLMAVALHGRTLREAQALAVAFEAMLRGGQPDPLLGDLAALQGIARLPARVRCAALPWDTFRLAAAQLSGRAG